MKLLRLGEAGREKPAVLLADGRVADVSAVVRDYDGAFFEQGGLDRLRDVVRRGDLPTIDAAGKRVGAPIP